MRSSLDLVDECGLTHLHVFPFSPRPGTPAAKMPQVARAVVKERARRLRDKGAAALVRHLDGEVGRQRRVLMESDNVGRTEQFTPVHVVAPAGAMIDAAITGHDGRQLLAAIVVRSSQRKPGPKDAFSHSPLPTVGMRQCYVAAASPH